MDAARWRLRAALTAAALFAGILPLGGCHQTSSSQPNAATTQSSELQKPEGDLISGIRNSSIPADARDAMEEYPPSTCARALDRSKLPPSWDLRGCAADHVVATTRLASFGLGDGPQPELLQHFILIEIVRGPTVLAAEYLRRLRLFTSSFRPGAERQRAITDSLGLGEISPFVAAGLIQPDGSFLGRAYLFDQSSQTICEFDGPGMSLVICCRHDSGQIVRISFLRARVASKFKRVLREISANASVLERE